MFDPASAAIGLGGIGLAGGMLQSQATKSAAKTAANASREAAEMQYRMFQEQQAAMEPWRASGVNALNQLNALMGLPQYSVPGNALAPVAGAGSPPVAPVMPTMDANLNAPSWIANSPLMRLSNESAMEKYNREYAEYQRKLAEYNAGTTVNMVRGADGSFSPGPQDWRSLMDPGYEFRKQEGINALAAAGAASGNYGSGNMGVALQDFGQNLASQEFQNVYNRLAGLSGTGQVQSQAIGNMGMNTGNVMANYLNQAGQNIAQGQVAGSNALFGGLRDAGSGLASYYMYRNNAPSYSDWYAASGQGNYGSNGWGLGELGNW